MDVTANTTPTELDRAPARNQRRPASLAAAAVGGVLGGVLLLFGVPQLIAGSQVAASQDVVWDLVKGRPMEPARLAEATADRADAWRWDPSAEREAERGFLLVRQAEAMPPGPERSQLLAAADAAIRAGLSVGPVQPHAWASLAALREHAGDRRGAVEALRLSMLSGAFEPDLMQWRLATGIRLLPLMDRETEALLRRQVRKAWVMAPERINQLAATPEAGPFVRRALEDVSEDEIADYVRRHGRK